MAGVLHLEQSCSKFERQQIIDLFHIVISLSLAARYLARFRVTSQTWGKL